MGAAASIEPRAVTVAPGTEASVTVRLRNTGTVVDQMTIEVLGDAAGWSTVVPPTLSLFPGADGVAWYELTRVGVTSVELEWRDYGRDLCMDEMFGAGGEFPRSLVERLTHRHDVLQELFQSLD